MKIYKSKYRHHWVSPYTILEKVFFWRKIDYDEPLIDKLASILDPFCVTWKKFLDSVHPEINYVKIDRWDTWNMDSTLAHIVLPMLKQLRDDKHGSGWVDDGDVPEELKSTSAPPKKYEHDWDDNVEYRWNYVLDEMIFAFGHLVDDSWEEEFRSGEMDIQWVQCEDNPKLKQMVEGPNHTYKMDYDGVREVNKRIDNGLRLFGKYYRNLWD